MEICVGWWRSLSGEIPQFWFSQTLLGLLFGTPLAPIAASSEYTVVIPVHNKRGTVAEVLESVFKQTKKPREVIVVDDASTDGSLEVLESFKEKIRLLRNTRNMGKAASINMAMDIVRTPYVLILDADTVLDEAFAHEAMRGFYSDSVQGVSGLVLPKNILSGPQKSRLAEYLLATPRKNLQIKMNGVWTLAGCSMMWKTSFLREHKVPTDTIVEDMDLSWETQTIKDGKGETMRLGYNPEAVSFTEDPEKFEDYKKQIHRWYSIGGILKKHFRRAPRGLKAIALWSFAESLVTLGWLALLAWFLLAGQYLSATVMAAADFLLMLALAVKYNKRYRSPYSRLTVLKSILWHYVYRFVNSIYFIKALLKPKRRW